MKEKSQADYYFPPEIISTFPASFAQPLARILNQHRSQSLLDIGCGDGALCRFARTAVPIVAGMEPAVQGFKNAQGAGGDIDYRNLGVYDPPPTEWMGRFDMIISTEVVEHLYDPNALPKLMKTCLKPGGTVIISTPYHGYIKNLILSLMNGWDSHHTALWHHGHIKFWSKNSLTKLMQQEGFEFVSFRGIGRFAFVWKSMMLEFRLAPRT